MVLASARVWKKKYTSSIKKLLQKSKKLQKQVLNKGLRKVVKTIMPIHLEGSPTICLGSRKNFSPKKVSDLGELDKGQIRLGKLIGAGGFGAVYRGEYEGRDVAVKMMRKQSKNPQALLESYKAEMHILPLRHPNIVRTLAASSLSQYKDGAWILMEYVGQKSLQTVLNERSECISTQRRTKYAFQLASALKHTHENFVVHLDIKPQNVLLTPDDNCKLGDYGCSQKVEVDTGVVSPTQRSALTGTFAYRAPELLRGEPPSFKADVYSFGITLWQILSRDTPYSGENQHVVIFGVVANGLRPKHPDLEMESDFENCYKELYSKCWSATPKERPSSSDLVNILKAWKDL